MCLSARRHTVRATCACAEGTVPPGRMNALALGTSASRASMPSSRSLMSSAVRPAGSGFVSGSGIVARYAPMLKSLFWMCCSWACTALGESDSAMSSPMWLESSSMVPYASRRMSSLAARWPPTREVVPASPVPVYSLLFSMIL